jgi:hypothetical protein
MSEQPALPYGTPATQGWSGSDTSRERAEREAAEGTAAERQQWVRTRLHTNGYFGLTVKELREATGWHHGQASSVLSVMHKEGQIARLKERRSKCAVYVYPAFVDGRPTAKHAANKKVTVAQYEEAVATIEQMVAYLNERNGVAALNYGALYLQGRQVRDGD